MAARTRVVAQGARNDATATVEARKRYADTPTPHPAGFIAFEFECDFPPSTNHLFATVTTARGGLRRIPTREYKAWREAVAYACKWLRWPEGNKARWELTIRLHDLPHTRDISNCVKAIEDLIVAHTGLDDAYTDDIRVSRCRGFPGGKRAEVRVRVNGWLLEEVG